MYVLKYFLKLRFHCFENLYANKIYVSSLFRISSTQIVKTEIYAVVEGTEDPESNIVVHPFGTIG